jgi:hypothetical protein
MTTPGHSRSGFLAGISICYLQSSIPYARREPIGNHTKENGALFR